MVSLDSTTACPRMWACTPRPARTAGAGSSSVSSTGTLSASASTSAGRVRASLPWSQLQWACRATSAPPPLTPPAAWRCEWTTVRSTSLTTSSISCAWGITASFALVAEPQTNYVAKRFNRTVKEQAINGRIFKNLDEVRRAVTAFIERYNAEWLVEKLGFVSPSRARRHFTLRVAAAQPPGSRVRYMIDGGDAVVDGGANGGGHAQDYPPRGRICPGLSDLSERVTLPLQFSRRGPLTRTAASMTTRPVANGVSSAQVHSGPGGAE